MLMAQRNIQYDEPVANQAGDRRKTAQPKAKAVNSVRKTTASRYSIQNLVIMLVIITVFGFIGAKTVYTTVVKGAEIRSLEKELAALNAENGLLQVEADKLRSVARIEEAALAMGMEKPEGTIYIAHNLIPPQTTLGVEQTQTAAAAPIEEKADSLLNNVFRIFTSFFASTQR